MERFHKGIGKRFSACKMEKYSWVTITDDQFSLSQNPRSINRVAVLNQLGLG